MSFSDTRVKELRVTEDTLTIDLLDGRSTSVPLVLYPTLLRATPDERTDCAPIGAGYGIEWSRLDYHLSVDRILQGIPEAPGVSRTALEQKR